MQFLEKTQKRRFKFETWAATKVKKTLIFDAIKQHGPPLRVGQFGNRVISSSPRSREFESCYLKTFFSRERAILKLLGVRAKNKEYKWNTQILFTSRKPPR